MKLITTPTPPYYAVIFTSIKNNDISDYAATAKRMFELASEQDGYLGYESASEDIGITISYWKDEASIKKWKLNAEHRIAQNRGVNDWYAAYSLKVCKVERAYSFNTNYTLKLP